jgi:anti-sigma B factor antagonist
LQDYLEESTSGAPFGAHPLVENRHNSRWIGMKFWSIQNGTIAIIELKGSLVGDGDTDQFREIVADFIEQGNKRLLISLHKLHYINSTGIGALIAAHTTYARIGGQVRLAGIQNTVQNVLVITKLIDVFDVHDTIEDAISGFAVQKTPSHP